MASLVGQSRIEIQARSVVTPGAGGTCPLSGTAKRFMMIQDSCLKSSLIFFFQFNFKTRKIIHDCLSTS